MVPYGYKYDLDWGIHDTVQCANMLHLHTTSLSSIDSYTGMEYRTRHKYRRINTNLHVSWVLYLSAQRQLATFVDPASSRRAWRRYRQSFKPIWPRTE